MFKLLVKKQFSEVFSFLFFNKKNGTKRTGGAVVMSVLLYVLLFAVVCFNFYFVASTLCKPLCDAGFAWLYFALFGLAALLFGVVGSALATYNSLYVAKDNEMLFSMPIKPRTILNARLVSVYLMSLLYVLLMFLPVVIAYFVNNALGFREVLFAVLTPFVLALLASAISCLLGWIISLFARRLKNKSFITIVVSVVFLGAYYYLSFNMSSLLGKILESPLIIASALKRSVYPVYMMGMGASGDTVNFILFALICFGAAAIVYTIIALGFAKTVIAGGSASHTRSSAVYSDKPVREGTVYAALFKKELARFTSSANYMLNANLGLLFMVAAAVALLIKGGLVRELFFSVLSPSSDAAALIACAAVCLISSMNVTTASSVSLEGRSLWIVQSLPVRPQTALNAKLKLHLVLILPALALLLAAVLITLRLPALHSILICIVSVLFLLFLAEIGLIFNLKWANVNWTNEVIPIKQSMSVFLAIFGGFVLLMAFAALYFLMSSSVSPLTFLMISGAILALASLLAYRAIVTWGAEKFAELS
ncbi:MAG: hypothetical protein IKI64_09655 [Clostridia bacterium]|nr:hypothetical protein [Clostridia bacterium]